MSKLDVRARPGVGRGLKRTAGLLHACPYMPRAWGGSAKPAVNHALTVRAALEAGIGGSGNLRQNVHVVSDVSDSGEHRVPT